MTQSNVSTDRERQSLSFFEKKVTERKVEQQGEHAQGEQAREGTNGKAQRESACAHKKEAIGRAREGTCVRICACVCVRVCACVCVRVRACACVGANTWRAIAPKAIRFSILHMRDTGLNKS